jgi:hypothetical protein
MTDPGGDWAAPAGGHGRLRASRADRERVIELLKVAFVQDRLTQDELDTRVGLALVSRTYADLADITADIPSGSAAAERAAEPAGTPARTLAKAVRRSGICMLIAFALVGVVALIGKEAWIPLAFFPGVAAVIAASGFVGYGVADAWQQRRYRKQLPPRPRWDGRGLEGGRLGSTGGDLAPPGTRTDQTRVELRTHRPGGAVPIRAGFAGATPCTPHTGCRITDRPRPQFVRPYMRHSGQHARLCRRHHCAKQARGRKLVQPEPGTMAWTIPSGRGYATGPTTYPG